MKKHTPGAVIAACVVAIITGFLQVFALPLSVMCVLGTIIAPVLFAWAGLIPALLFLAVSIGSLGAVFATLQTTSGVAGALVGAGFAGAGALLVGVPSAVIMALMAQRAPYFTRMKAAVGVQLAALLALILALYAMLGRSLVDVAMENLTAWADGLPPQMAAFMLQQFAVTGAGTYMSQETALQILTEGVSEAECFDMLHSIFDTMGQALRLGLPAMLLSSGLVTGLFATAVPGRICARRGDDLEYVPLSAWFVPVRLTIGVVVCLLTAGILYAAKVNGAESVLNAVLTAGSVIYAAAGAAALSRRFKEAGRSPVFRTVMIALGLWFVTRLVTFIGIYSVLFGRRGLISGYVKKKMEERNKEDDD